MEDSLRKVYKELHSCEMLLKTIPESSLLPHTVEEVKKLIDKIEIQRKLSEELVHSTDHRINEHSEDINLLNNRIDTMAETFADMAQFTGYDQYKNPGFYNKDLERAMRDMVTHGVGAVKHVPLEEMVEAEGSWSTRMRRFQLIRNVDATGVSGTGCVAEGVEFADGSCCLSWLAGHTSLGIYPNVKAVENIHGHDGDTVVIYLD